MLVHVLGGGLSKQQIKMMVPRGGVRLKRKGARCLLIFRCWEVRNRRR